MAYEGRLFVLNVVSCFNIKVKTFIFSGYG